MSEHMQGLNRDQTALLSDTLEGCVDKDKPVRFIDAFIEGLNLTKLGFKHAVPSEAGHPATPQAYSNYASMATSIRSDQAESLSVNAIETLR
jgi:hypothetical protein